MPIKKQEFYEGAALHLLLRNGEIRSVQYVSPFFLLDDRLLVYFKYSTKGRSPWGFTFMPEEQALLEQRAANSELAIALICGSDGVAAVRHSLFASVANQKTTANHIACHRLHGKHYSISGPNGTLDNKVAPSTWQKILEN
jgi:hypothetical protein